MPLDVNVPGEVSSEIFFQDVLCYSIYRLRGLAKVLHDTSQFQIPAGLVAEVLHGIAAQREELSRTSMPTRLTYGTADKFNCRLTVAFLDGKVGEAGLAEKQLSNEMVKW